MQNYQKIVIIGVRLNFFKVPFSVIFKIKSIYVGVDLSLYRLTQKMFKISKKTWLLVAFLMLAVPSFSEIFKPATSFRLEDSFGGKVKLTAIPLKTDLVTKVQLKENKLKASNGHDQLTIRLKIKVDKDLQHYDVEKDEDSSECSKDEKWDGQHSNIKNGKESKETKESSWKDSSIVTTIVKPEVKINPSSVTKIVEKLPTTTASSQKITTTSLPIITSTGLAPSSFTVTSNVPKEAKAEGNSAKKDQKDEKTINNVVLIEPSVIKPARINVGKIQEESKLTPVLGSTPIVGSIQPKEEAKHIEAVVQAGKKSDQKQEGEKKNPSPAAPKISVGLPLTVSNVVKPSLTVEHKPIEMKKERTESKSSEDSESDSKKHETKAVDSIKNVAHPNAEKIVIAEPTKSEVLSLAKPQEKVIKFEEKKENLPLNNAINPKFAQETFIKPAFISSNPASETEVKKISKETPTATSPKRFFADAVNPLAAKRSIPSETYSATHSAPTSLVHTL